jgi:hypothetical protein
MGFKQVCGSLPETLSAKDLPERKKAGEIFLAGRVLDGCIVTGQTGY